MGRWFGCRVKGAEIVVAAFVCVGLLLLDWIRFSIAVGFHILRVRDRDRKYAEIHVFLTLIFRPQALNP